MSPAGWVAIISNGHGLRRRRREPHYDGTLIRQSKEANPARRRALRDGELSRTSFKTFILLYFRSFPKPRFEFT